MNNAEVAREKYLKLMTKIEDMEDEIDKLEKSGKSGDSLVNLKNSLAELRNELSRISDGCGKPHAH